MTFESEDVTNLSNDELQNLMSSSWRCIPINARLTCPPFTWFTNKGWRVIKGALLVAPHISIPSEFLAGEYSLNNELSRERFKRFNDWYGSLVEGADYIKITRL